MLRAINTLFQNKMDVHALRRVIDLVQLDCNVYNLMFCSCGVIRKYVCLATHLHFTNSLFT